nr:MAG TPA: hypothetical protein [Caudoviricetes sp.]
MFSFLLLQSKRYSITISQFKINTCLILLIHILNHITDFTQPIY